MLKFILTLCCFTTICWAHPIFMWRPAVGENFGDYLSKVIVERIIKKEVRIGTIYTNEKMLFTVGSVIHFAKEGDVIWGSGFRDDFLLKQLRFKKLDVRAVRGPITRKMLMDLGIKCPAVYGDPALLMPLLFPELKVQKPIYDYIIIPNIGEISSFAPYKNVVLPTEPWDVVIDKILKSRFVISSSLHGIIVAEAFGIPARFLKMTWDQPLLKYEDYYLSTKRPDFEYATSVRQALQMGGERPVDINLEPLMNNFPYDFFK